MRPMHRSLGQVVIVLMAVGWSTADAVPPAIVRPLVDLRSLDRSPFPSDYFTVADARPNTGRRVNLPMPADCTANASECEDRAVLNQLDGFNMQPRITVPFDGEIDPATVTSRTVILLNLTSGDDAPIGINQVVWDPPTKELSFRPEISLEQHTRYGLVVTTGVHDRNGQAIDVARTDAAGDYGRALAAAEQRVRRANVLERGVDIAVLSVFTTQSFSHIIERIRDAIDRAPAPRLTVAVGTDGERAIFQAADIATLTDNAHVRVNGPPTIESLAQPLAMRIIPGAVGTVAFGTFRALDFTTSPSGHIAPIPTRTGRMAPLRTVDVAFTLWLPSGAPPAGGWPIAIYGHGAYGHKTSAFPHAAVLNSHGIAVIGFNGMGRGRGPQTTMTVTRGDGTSTTFPAPGLGYDQDGDGEIGAWEPRHALRPHAIYATSGPTVQTAAIILQLARGIQAGVDVDGDNRPDLHRSRIYYFGQSMGSVFGPPAFAYAPAIRAAVFNVPVGTLTDQRRLDPASRTQLGFDLLARRTPPLLNSGDGVAAIEGRPVAAPLFNENQPLRTNGRFQVGLAAGTIRDVQSPLVNDVPGAIAIQRVFDRSDWADQIASSVAFAALLRRAAAGVPARPFLVQFARSDGNAPNPNTTEFIRSGGFADRAMIYRHDLNFARGGVPPNPHAFLSSVNAPPNFSRVALGAQQQIAEFFASDGVKVIHPTPAEFWEVPVKSQLPEDLLFLSRPR